MLLRYCRICLLFLPSQAERRLSFLSPDPPTTVFLPGMKFPWILSDVSCFLSPPAGRWRKRHLTYRIYSHSDDLGAAGTRTAIQTAFRYWSDVTHLTFQEVRTGRADIRLSFHGSAPWGCSRAFDGPGTDPIMAGGGDDLGLGKGVAGGIRKGGVGGVQICSGRYLDARTSC